MKRREMIMSTLVILVSAWAALFLLLSTSSLPTIAASSTARSPNLESSNFTGTSDLEPSIVVQEHEQFPRLLHYLWPNKNFSFGDNDPQDIEQHQTQVIVQRILDSNPEWKIKIWTDEECYALVREHFPDFYSQWTSLTPRLKMWDAVRPMILYIHGGIYLDHDIDCDEGVHFSDWIGPNTTLLLRKPSGGKDSLGNHFMGSAPNHSIWTLYLENIIKTTPKNPSVVKHTGPKQLYLTFQEYTAGLTDLSQIRLLELHELGTNLECKRAAGNNDTLCLQPRCRHKLSVSPAELAGEDDNANFQIEGFRKRMGLPPLNNTFNKLQCTCRRLKQFLNQTSPAVFIHVPKTGGTTIEKLMDRRGSCHAFASDMRACSPIEYKKALSFAALRHPLERVISMFKYAQKGGNNSKRDRKKFGWVRGLNFSEFVEALPEQRQVNFAPQAQFMTDPGNASSILVDEILCTEDLNAGWQRLATLKPSLKKYGEFPAARSRVTPVHIAHVTADQVDAKTKKQLRGIFHDDFVLWEKYCGRRSTLPP